MSLIGNVSRSYVLAVGGELNGPIIGGIFTIVGFGGFRKNHIKKCSADFCRGICCWSFNVSGDSFPTLPLLAALFGNATLRLLLAAYYGSTCLI